MIPLLPSWTVSLGALVYIYLLARRYRYERRAILMGKIVALIAVASAYLVFNFSVFDILTDRALSRWVWVFYLLTEIVYTIARSVRERNNE
jgi:hypothetical protein